ncbi:hypothetical protein FACS189443_4500 [Planctomycetales bacterium]|nr:hypothetical protein FACS189443_4500 [Planctomycetales bacterium]
MKNAQLKKGEIPQEFKSNPHRLAQKECDGNWAKKGNAAFFGYKDHPWVDVFWKLMWGKTKRYEVLVLRGQSFG